MQGIKVDSSGLNNYLKSNLKNGFLKKKKKKKTAMHNCLLLVFYYFIIIISINNLI